jgi:hypothetical protein
MELSMIVPDCAEESPPPQRPNKGVVLRKSADYIRYLQEANARLAQQLAMHGISPAVGTDPTGPLSAGSIAANAAGAAAAAASAGGTHAPGAVLEDDMMGGDDDDGDDDDDAM